MKFRLRVYYEDTDFSGFVYHARYLHFFERSRTEVLRSVGIDQHKIFRAEEGSSAFVVRKLSIDYISPAYMDDELEVETLVDTIKGASIRMVQTLYRQENILAKAEVLIAYVKQGRPARLSDTLKKAIEMIKKTPHQI